MKIILKASWNEPPLWIEMPWDHWFEKNFQWISLVQCLRPRTSRWDYDKVILTLWWIAEAGKALRKIIDITQSINEKIVLGFVDVSKWRRSPNSTEQKAYKTHKRSNFLPGTPYWLKPAMIVWVLGTEKWSKESDHLKYDPKPFGRIVITQDGLFPTVVKEDVVDNCSLLCERWLSSAAEIFIGSTIHKPTISGNCFFRTTDDAYNPT